MAWHPPPPHLPFMWLPPLTLSTYRTDVSCFPEYGNTDPFWVTSHREGLLILLLCCSVLSWQPACFLPPHRSPNCLFYNKGCSYHWLSGPFCSLSLITLPKLLALITSANRKNFFTPPPHPFILSVICIALGEILHILVLLDIIHVKCCVHSGQWWDQVPSSVETHKSIFLYFENASFQGTEC